MSQLVIIVPGFSESRKHFKKLENVLHRTGYRTLVIQPWELKELKKYEGEAVYLGHSIGSYVLAKNNLMPSLLVGLPDKLLVKQNFRKFIKGVRLHAKANQYIYEYYWNRFINGVSLLKNAVPTAKLAHFFDHDNFKQPEKQDRVILLQNTNDILVKKVPHALAHQGHHEDLLYYPEPYVPYIQQLANGID